MFDDKFEEENVKNKPMTFKDLRQRLKHIAGLCWGLSIDLQNEIELNNQLKTDNEALKAENKVLNHRLRCRNYHRKKNLEEILQKNN